MTGRSINILSFLIALLVAGTIGSGLWLNYRQECQSHAQMLVIRGQSVLTALEGGLRSHQRMGGGFEQNVRSMLEESAKAPGIIGLGILERDGKPLSISGKLPETLQLKTEPQWTHGGLLLALMTELGKGPQTGGGFRPGRGRARMLEERTYGAYKEPVWLSVLMDDTEYRQELEKERWHFGLSLLTTVLVILMGLGIIVVLQQQGRLRAELNLGTEREKRLEELTRLGAGLAHETKNPLSLIRGLAQQWLSRTNIDHDFQREAKQVVDEADRIVGRINSFLAYSRPAKPNLQVLDLAALLGDMTRLFQDEARAKGLKLIATLPPEQVYADPDMLRQIVVNLLANAVAFCRAEDRIEVRIEPDGRTGPQQQIGFAVRDTGPGVAPEDLEQVTKPYFSRRPGGTGLGLAIVQQIVEAHGWQLEIDSAPGRGTTVRIGGIKQEGSRKS